MRIATGAPVGAVVGAIVGAVYPHKNVDSEFLGTLIVSETLKSASLLLVSTHLSVFCHGKLMDKIWIKVDKI